MAATSAKASQLHQHSVLAGVGSVAAASASDSGALIAAGGYHALGIGLMLFALAASALVWWPPAAIFSLIKAPLSQGIRLLTAGRRSVGPTLFALLRVAALAYQQAVGSRPSRVSRWRARNDAE